MNSIYLEIVGYIGVALVLLPMTAGSLRKHRIIFAYQRISRAFAELGSHSDKSI